MIARISSKKKFCRTTFLQGARTGSAVSVPGHAAIRLCFGGGPGSEVTADRLAPELRAWIGGKADRSETIEAVYDAAAERYRVARETSFRKLSAACFELTGDVTVERLFTRRYVVMYATGEETGDGGSAGTLYHDLLDAASRAKADQHPIDAVTGLRGELDNRVLQTDTRLSDARPASDVYAWAKAPAKPACDWDEISGKPAAFTPSAHTHATVDITDRRGITMSPTGMPSYSLSTFFNSTGTPDGNWWSGISLTGWAADAYAAWQMTGIAGRASLSEWYLRSGVGDTWQPWRRIWHDGNAGTPACDWQAKNITAAGNVVMYATSNDTGGGGSAGTLYHDLLDAASRAKADQHPIAAVTGLRGELDSRILSNDARLTNARPANGGNADTVDGVHIDRAVSEVLPAALLGYAGDSTRAGYYSPDAVKTLSGDNGYVMRKYVIDCTALDQSTYYPITFIAATKYNTRAELITVVGYSGKPSWATHANGFSCRLIWETNGNGWGVTPVNRTVYASDYNWTTANPLGGNGQLIKSSTEYVYVLGGGKYTLYLSHNAEPVLQTTAYTVYDQTVGPTTAPPFNAVRTNARLADMPTTLPASDVYAWAKAAAKPTYGWGEITGKPATFAPSAHTHADLDVTDRRGTTMLPSGMPSNALCTFFNNTGTPTGDWWSGFSVTGWNAASYAAWQMTGFASTSSKSEWYLRSGVGSTWQSWRRIWHDGNLTPADYLARSGGVMTGNIKLSADAYLTDLNGTTLFGVDSSGLVVGSPNIAARFRSNNTDLTHERYGSKYKIWDAANAGTPAFDWLAKNITAAGTIKAAGSVVMYAV